MEENKNKNLLLEKNNIIIKQSNKLVNFNLNNFTSHLLNLGDYDGVINKMNKTNIKKNINNENGDNINNNENKYSSPKKQFNAFLKPNRKEFFHTPNYFYSSFKNVKNNLRKNSMNIIMSRNNNLNQYESDKSNSLYNNGTSLKRLETANDSHMITSRPSAFLIKNKRLSNSKLGFRNSKILNLHSNKLLKSEEDGKIVTINNILTDRNKKESIFLKNISHRNSINKRIIKNNRRLKTLSYGKFSKKHKTPQNSKKDFKPVIVNPLLISDEDKIFDEMKKYLFFKYEQKHLQSKSTEEKKHIDKSKLISSKLKSKNKIQTTDQIKLDYLYLSNTKINRKIKHIQRNKERHDLGEYQNTLLDAIKPTISDSTYTQLKDRLIDIRKKNSKKYSNNYKKIKEIENEEEDIINDFNTICKNCVRTFQRARQQKDVIHSNNLKIKLPLLNFISCLKKKKKQIKRKSLITLKKK